MGSELNNSTEQAKAAAVDRDRVEGFLATARGFVDRGDVPSIQVALARGNVLAAVGAFGEASFSGENRPVDEHTLYAGYSTTKGLVASTVWRLIEDGVVDEAQAVAEWIPEFATNDKQAVTIRHLLTHSAGFPNAPFGVLEWPDRARRLERFASWRLEWEPGSQVEYHATSASWVLAELIERACDVPYTECIRSRVLEPLGLGDSLFVGLPEDTNSRVAEVVHVGEAPSAAELDNLGLDKSVDKSGDEVYLSGYNRPDWRAVGAPGSGVCATAAGLAMFCQALLSGGVAPDGTRVWQADTIASALAVRTDDLTDPMTGALANRCLGLVVSGDESRMYRGFCPANSPTAFGHAGVGGQLMWGDPATGLSFAVLTNGLERNPMRMGMRNLMLSSQAAECAP